jgi:hypothetical protein
VSASRIALIADANDYLFAFDFDGSTWRKTGGITIASAGTAGLAMLTDSTIAFVDATNASLRTYSYLSAFAPIGTDLVLAGVSSSAIMAAMSSGRIAFIDNNSDALRAYDFDGIGWSQSGAVFPLAVTSPSIAAMTPSRIAFIGADAQPSELRAYDFNGSTWSQVGSGLITIAAGISGSFSLAAMSSSMVALADSVTKSLRAYTFDGAVWSPTGSARGLGTYGAAQLCALSSSIIASVDTDIGALQAWQFNGSSWARLGIPLNVDLDSSIAQCGLCALSSSRIALISATTDQIDLFDFDGYAWSFHSSIQRGGGGNVNGIVALTPTRLVTADPTSDSIKAYDIVEHLRVSASGDSALIQVSGFANQTYEWVVMAEVLG